MQPTIGRIVIYNTTALEQYVSPTGKFPANSQKQLPAVIVAVWSDSCVNLQVLPDGDITQAIWKTSALQGDLPGHWNWPVITPAPQTIKDL